MVAGSSQCHPLYGSDRLIVDRLLLAATPADQDAADCARLLIRYQDFSGAYDIRDDLHRCLDRWHMSSEELNQRCLALWSSGWRPVIHGSLEVGSGADVKES